MIQKSGIPPIVLAYLMLSASADDRSDIRTLSTGLWFDDQDALVNVSTSPRGTHLRFVQIDGPTFETDSFQSVSPIELPGLPGPDVTTGDVETPDGVPNDGKAEGELGAVSKLNSEEAVLLEEDPGPWTWKPPLRQGAWSWTSQGDGKKGIGFFSLEDEPNLELNFDVPKISNIGFKTGIHFLSGPVRSDLPPRLFDLSFNIHIRRELASDIGVDANFNLGVFTDFEDSVRDGWRFPGRALAYLRQDNALTWVAGFEYVDTDIMQILPAGGAIYQPNDDWRLELYFPSPQVRFRVNEDEESEGWLYLAGNYRGRAWAIERQTGNADVASLNEYRLSLGHETRWKEKQSHSSFLEFSWLLQRKLEYRSGVGSLHPSDALMIRLGSRY